MNKKKYDMKKIIREGKKVIDEYDQTIFRQIGNYEYVIDDERTEKEIMAEYLKWHREFYGDSNSITRFSDKNTIENFKLLKSNVTIKLPVIIKCILYFVGDGSKDGDYPFYKVGKDGHYTDKKLRKSYPCYNRPNYNKKEVVDKFANSNMLMASELTAVYGPALYICKIKRVKN